MLNATRAWKIAMVKKSGWRCGPRSPILCAPDITHHKEHTQLRLTVHSPGTPETHPMRCETAEMPGTDPLLPVFCLMNDLLRLAVCLAEATEAQS
jgi:hypothetical protein